jgi:two-component system, NarL family, response regulator DevR
MLKIYIADDSVVVRGKLKEALEENGTIQVVGESGNALQAMAEIQPLDPQVVIIDIHMPGGGGLLVLKDIKTRAPGRIAIILTSFASQQYRDAYLAEGADYFFDKTQDIPKLIEVMFHLASTSPSPTFGILDN